VCLGNPRASFSQRPASSIHPAIYLQQRGRPATRCESHATPRPYYPPQPPAIGAGIFNPHRRHRRTAAYYSPNLLSLTILLSLPRRLCRIRRYPIVAPTLELSAPRLRSFDFALYWGNMQVQGRCFLKENPTPRPSPSRRGSIPRRSRRSQLLLLGSALLCGNLKPVQLCAQVLSPTRILVCESRNDACNQPDARLDISWIFNGAEGRTAGSGGSVADSRVRIERFDSDSIIVRRVDQVGPTAGLTALYTGSVRGIHINGTVQWSWPDHPGYPTAGVFSALLQDQPSVAAQSEAAPGRTSDELPSELLVCENNDPCNSAWFIHGSEGKATWFVRDPVHAKLTVIRSTPDDILIRRTDTTDEVSATYAGSLRGDRYSGTIVWSTPGHPGASTGTWTATLPQTDCAAQAGIDPGDALRLGQTALMFHRDRDALDCYTAAATGGDATAQAAVGLIYYQGRGVIPQDYTQALFWLRKAADQGVYAAQRTVAEMYAVGQGTHRDPAFSAIYTARADEQKHDLERRQDLADRAADRRAQMLSSFILGASFGAFLFF